MSSPPSLPPSLTGELRPDLMEPCYDKVALLIGNKNYRQSTLKLNTPENDAQDLGGVLRSAGFKVVSLVNLNKVEMEKVRSNESVHCVTGLTCSLLIN